MYYTARGRVRGGKSGNREWGRMRKMLGKWWPGEQETGQESQSVNGKGEKKLRSGLFRYTTQASEHSLRGNKH